MGGRPGRRNTNSPPDAKPVRYAKFMKLLNVCSFILILLYATNCFGQDTTSYCQANTRWYGSNCYLFYKTNKMDHIGNFIKIMQFDDGQCFYGRGTFREKGKKIVLDSFTLIRTLYHVSIGDSIKKVVEKDSSVIPRLIFYKSGNDLIEKDKKNEPKTLYTRPKKIPRICCYRFNVPTKDFA